ncbi:MAG: hypothetical protein KTR25_11740 [Myxococcales bacterium]|nr:hypothetical protein [Myxococcales bacterium]
MSDDRLRQVLARFGYRLLFREHAWVDCLITSFEESFEGHGPDKASALNDALARACPSRLSKELLDEAVGGLIAVRTVRDVASDRTGTSAIFSAISEDDWGNGRSASDVTSAAGANLLAEDRPPRSQMAQEMPRLVPVPNPSVDRATVDRPAIDRSRALEELEILMERIKQSRDELAWSTAPRQRLAILAWICEARSHTDLFPEELDIRDGVARVSRLLTEIGKAYWPGSVTALQLQMQPTDLPRHLLGGTPSTWARAAELAERALLNLEHSDERRGQDAYGWGDADRLSPEPEDAQTLIFELVDSVEASWGPLDRFAEPRNPTDFPEPEHFQRWVRELRWLRLQCIEPDLWARIMGRLRWWACRRNGPVQAGGRELEPGFRPERPWGELLGRQGVVRDQVLLPESLVSEVRARYVGKKLLCVSNRRDLVEQSRLNEALPDTQFDWRIAENGLLEHVPVMLEEHGYHGVIAAVGLQAPVVDRMLVRGCREAHVPYFRANRGQTLACLRALVRAVG